ncbi:MAG: DinB family protein [Rudaea sp.]
MNGEIETYLARLTGLRSEVWETLEDLDTAALNWTPLPEGTNSLLVLATHSLGAEHGWIAEVVGREPKTRIRANEFRARGSGLEQLRERFEATARESERILSGLNESDLNETREGTSGETVTVRWAIIHVIEHYAEHLGQMSLTRQLWGSKNNA